MTLSQEAKDYLCTLAERISGLPDEAKCIALRSQRNFWIRVLPFHSQEDQADVLAVIRMIDACLYALGDNSETRQ